MVVIAAEPEGRKPSAWTADVANNPYIEVHRLPARFPAALTRESSSIWGKLAYRLAYQKMRLLAKGDFLDRAALWGTQVRAKAAQLIQEKNIRHAVVTVGPFHLGYQVAQLKKTHPNLRLLVDMRDPWTRHNEEWSFGNLSLARHQQEVEMENNMVQLADGVISVYQETVEYLAERTPEWRSKCLVLPNGYDPEDVPQNLPGPPADGRLRLVFTGTFYDKLNYLFEPLLDALDALKARHAELYAKMELNFFGDAPRNIQELAAQRHPAVVQFHGRVTLEEVYRQIARANAAMLFLIRNYEFSRSTKYYEYRALKRPIVLFSGTGGLATSIRHQALGWVVDPATATEDFINAIQALDAGQLPAGATNNAQTLRVDEMAVQLASIIRGTASPEAV